MGHKPNGRVKTGIRMYAQSAVIKGNSCTNTPPPPKNKAPDTLHCRRSSCWEREVIFECVHQLHPYVYPFAFIWFLAGQLFEIISSVCTNLFNINREAGERKIRDVCDIPAYREWRQG